MLVNIIDQRKEGGREGENRDFRLQANDWGGTRACSPNLHPGSMGWEQGIWKVCASDDFPAMGPN